MRGTGIGRASAAAPKSPARGPYQSPVPTPPDDRGNAHRSRSASPAVHRLCMNRHRRPHIRPVHPQHHPGRGRRRPRAVIHSAPTQTLMLLSIVTARASEGPGPRAHVLVPWVPAFAGMTAVGVSDENQPGVVSGRRVRSAACVKSCAVLALGGRCGFLDRITTECVRLAAGKARATPDLVPLLTLPVAATSHRPEARSINFYLRSRVRRSRATSRPRGRIVDGNNSLPFICPPDSASQPPPRTLRRTARHDLLSMPSPLGGGE